MKNNKGFSLVELVIVIAIMAILIGVAVPVFSSYVEKSAKEKDIALVDEMADAIVLANNSGHILFAVEGQYEKGMQIPVGYIVISDTKIDGDNYVKVIGQGITYPEEGEDGCPAIEDALKATFGDDYATKLSLTYDGWNGNVGSFFSSASNMIDQVKTTGQSALEFADLLDKSSMLLQAVKMRYNSETGWIEKNEGGYFNPSWKNYKQLMSGDYKNEQGKRDSALLLLSVADIVANTPQSTFESGWMNVHTTDQEGFGLVGATREHLSACRKAYNICFAAYAEAAEHSEHKAEIESFGKSALELLGIGDISIGDFTFPQTVCESVFDNPDFAKYEFTKCSTCKDLYSKYHGSEQAKADANNFYNTMVTGNELGSDAYEEDPTSLFDWMKGQAAPFETATNAINGYTNGKSAIVLTVYYKDGQIVVDYTPIEATP